jgi:hypothetical protein
MSEKDKKELEEYILKRVAARAQSVPQEVLPIASKPLIL